MDISEYISSGVIDAYVLGIATEEELHELNKLRFQYPEIERAIQEQELLMEQYARAQSVVPPPSLKGNIWAAIQNESNTPKETPPINIDATSLATPKKEKGWQQYGMAASVALLVALGASNIWMQKQQSKMNAELAAMTKRQNELVAANKAAIEKAEQAEQALTVMSLPQLKKIKLGGVGAHTASSAMLYWNGANGDVFVDLSSMPAAPEGKQYQLWAIVDGKPVDAGMYVANNESLIEKMKNIPKAEMFAITIEKMGGSPSPTLDQMIVAGKAI